MKKADRHQNLWCLSIQIQKDWGSAKAQLGERRSLVSELHTSLVRVRASPASMYFQSGGYKCMWSGCRRADPVVSQAYSRDAEICPGFPPPQAALVTVTSGEKGLWVVYGEVRLRVIGREILIGMITDQWLG